MSPSGQASGTAPPHRLVETEVLRADSDGVARAASLLREGRLVALPTETVYGLGADARDAGAVARIYAAKERPRFNPLIAHFDTPAAARREGVLNCDAEALAAAFWPGPLTLVVPHAATGTVCDLARSGLSSVALRVPSHPIARDLLARAGIPVVAPSANRSGRISPTAAAHVLAELGGRIDAVLDGGDCAVGVESTVVACLNGETSLLRPGGITRAGLEEVLRRPLQTMPESDTARPLAPGGLASHYAPRATVRLDAATVSPDEAGLLFGPGDEASSAAATLNLSPSGDLAEAAANLFGYLRRLDATGVAVIAVSPIPDIGLGEAINDRLRRAAANR